jgi:hypothetical protein
MIILLFVLAGLMVLSGGAAVLHGWDVVLNERGWTQVIAGATLLTGGLLMIGIAVSARELHRLRRELVAAVAIPEDEEAPDEAPPVMPGRLAAAAAGPAAEPPRPEVAPAVGPLEPARPEPPRTEPDLRDALTRKLDEDLARLARSRDIPIAPLPRPGPRPVETGTEPEEPAEAEEAAVVEPAPPAAPSMIGTYASGGITYFMFSDNSIEADMEGGRYQFHSMEDLRRFLETGEGGTLLAAADERTPVAS